jgi:hypothetical protein
METIEEEKTELKRFLRTHITTTITVEMFEKAKACQPPIKMSEALRVGIGVLLAESGDDSYIGTINVYRKCQILQEILEDTTKKLNVVTKK